MSVAYVALGSNIGELELNIARALELMEQHAIKVLAVAPYIMTKPYGVEDQPDFLNTAAKVEYSGTAYELLVELLAIEQEMGRVRLRHWGERNIDLDLIFFENTILNLPDLTLPHPEMHKRSFVLEPITALAPKYKHPILHQTMEELLQEL